MSVVTKIGDGGKTRIKGKLVGKDSQLLEVLGNIDELNCFLGWLKVESRNKNIFKIQKDLWQISAHLACKKKIVLKKRVEWLEDTIYGIEKKLPVLKKFVVPGVNKKEAVVQICRSVSRRVERSLWKVNKYIKVDENVLIYFNRLSDYLFTIGRINT